MDQRAPGLLGAVRRKRTSGPSGSVQQLLHLHKAEQNAPAILSAFGSNDLWLE